MHAWPSHHRPPNQTKKNKKFVVENYPVLDHGVIGAATLVESNGKLEWDSLISAHPTPSRYRLTQTFDVFPATKPPPIQEPAVTITRRADQGTHFLRKLFPEVDVSAEVIRNQITESTLQAVTLAEFDPFEGNILGSVTGHDKKTQLVFPMGELSNELNLTPISVTDSGRTVIRPTTRPLRTFSTPIQQITSSPALTHDETSRKGISLAVRTFGATSLLKLDPEPTSNGGLTDVTHFNSHDVSGAPIMDVKITPEGSPFEALLTNRKGGVYGCSLLGGKKTMVKLYTDLESSSLDTFWRLGQGSKPTECTILSGKSLNQLDFRTNQVTPLLTEETKDFLTSAEDYAQDNIVRLVSTSQVIWLDPRFPGKPLLGYKHHRQFDRTLHTTTCFANSYPTTFLNSKRNGLTTIYNVSRQKEQPIRANDSPYSILPPRSHLRCAGETFLQHESCDITVFRIDDQAKIHCLQLSNAAAGDSEISHTVIVEKSDAVKELEMNVGSTKNKLQKYGDQDKSITNLYSAYDHIFRLRAEKQENVEEEQAEEFYDLMDRLPTFWQAHDAPAEHMLTSYDIVFRSQENSGQTSRSDFTTGSVINSTRGFRALSQNKFPTVDLRKGAPWHMSIANTQNRIDPSLDLNMTAQDLAESLHSYDLIQDDNRTTSSIRRENDAREQLAVDLVLSGDVYSPSPFIPPREVRDDLETMTEALSLGEHDTDEPPEMEFGYLRPVDKARGTDHYDEGKELEGGEAEKKESAGRVSLPVGVRSLLKDWEVGTKAKDYVFRDPYSTTEESAPQSIAQPAVGRSVSSTLVPGMSQPIPSQRPPTVMSSRALDSGGFSARLGSSQPQIGTQSARKFGVGAPQSSLSQDYSQQSQPMASTQVLPGPYGGRPTKKPAKKRLGGF